MGFWDTTAVTEAEAGRDRPFLAWGMPGVAVVPAVLCQAWAERPLPTRLAQAVGLADGTWAELDERVWDDRVLDAAALERAVVAAVTKELAPAERRHLVPRRILPRHWPPDLDPADVPFRNRTRTALERAGALSSPARASALRVGELLGATRAGTIALLDFGCTAEAALAWHEGRHAGRVVGAADDPELVEVAGEPWADAVAGDDGRFSDVLGPIWRGTVAELVARGPRAAKEALLRVLPDLEQRLAELTALPLEDALAAYVRGLTGTARARMDDERLRVVLARLGLAGDPPLLLQEAGDLVGLTRERVRQLEAAVRERRTASSPRPYLPQLDSALATVAEAVPLPASQVGPLLARRGVSRRAFGPESLLSAADFLGRDLTFVVTADMVLPDFSAAPHGAKIAALARAEAGRYGASNLAELAATLAEEGLVLPEDEIALVVATCHNVVLGDDGWFWLRGGEGPFLRTSLRMLAVHTPLPVPSLRDGLRRRHAFRRYPVVPLARVLADVYRDHPAFRVDRAGLVWPVEPLDPAEVLGALDQEMVAILRAAPGGALDRAELFRACTEAGLKIGSVKVFAIYSPCIEQVGAGVFAVRGGRFDPEVAAELERRAGTAGVRPSGVGETSGGRPWAAIELERAPLEEGVVTLPAEVRRHLAGRRFALRTASGGACGELSVDASGRVRGWETLFRRSGAEPGDVVRTTFDPSTGTAEVELGGPELVTTRRRSVKGAEG